MRVLFAASGIGHIRSFHMPYIYELHRMGWEIDVACRCDSGGRIPYCRMIPIPLKKSMAALSNFMAVRILCKEMKSRGYDLVITHTSLASFFVRLALMMSGKQIPVVCVVHGYLFYESEKPYKRLVLMMAEKLAAGVTTYLLTMNKWDFKYAKMHHLGRHVAKIPGMGFNSRKFVSENDELRAKMGIDRDDIVLIYAAEFSKRKDQEFLLDVMTELPDNIRLILAGEGEYLDRCIQKATELGIKDRVIFTGHLDDISSRYAISDICISSSRSEGLPFNIMEAMYVGLPVVATEVKGHTDLIEDGVNGFLYRTLDKAECVQAVLRLSESSILREKLGKNGQDIVREYTLDNVMPVVMGWYKKAVGMKVLSKM